MTTDLPLEYTFIARINAKGKQGSSWKLEFDWQLPGSRFPFVLYGRDPADIEGWHDGDCPEVSITRGLLKSGKTGQYASDYFYDLVSIEPNEEAANDPLGDQLRGIGGPKPARQGSGLGPDPWQEPTPQSPSGGAGPETGWRDPVRASIERQVALKAAVELAGYKITAGKDLGAREVMAVATLFDRWLGRHFEVDSQEQEA